MLDKQKRYLSIKLVRSGLGKLREHGHLTIKQKNLANAGSRWNNKMKIVAVVSQLRLDCRTLQIHCRFTIHTIVLLLHLDPAIDKF